MSFLVLQPTRLRFRLVSRRLPTYATTRCPFSPLRTTTTSITADLIHASRFLHSRSTMTFQRHALLPRLLHSSQCRRWRKTALSTRCRSSVPCLLLPTQAAIAKIKCLTSHSPAQRYHLVLRPPRKSLHMWRMHSQIYRRHRKDARVRFLSR